MSNPHLTGLRSDRIHGQVADTVTIPTSKTLAVTTADKLTIGGSIVSPNVVVRFTGQTTEAATDRVVFLCDRAYTLVGVYQIHSVAAGGASVVQLVKDTGTDAPGAGTNILTNNSSTGFDLNATANTMQTGTFAATTFAAGNRISIDFANAIQSTAGLALTIVLKPS